MNDKVLFLKTLSGEDILGTYAHISECDGIDLVYLHFPIKLEQKVIFTPAGLYTNHIPTLYAPYGKSNTVALRRDNFQIITVASDFSARYYQVVLSELLLVETKRILSTSKSFDLAEYPNLHIHETPQTLQ